MCVALRYTTETVASMCLLEAEGETELEVFSQAQNNRRQPLLLLTFSFSVSDSKTQQKQTLIFEQLVTETRLIFAVL